jgi:YegS/Rv2252/BmrU family lipid kinase
MKRVVFIVNPSSRPMRVRQNIPAIEALLREGGYSVETAVTEKAGDPGAMAAAAVDSADVLLVAGGDGTVSEVLDAVMDRGTPLGLIPLGTTNVFARELGIPMDPLEATRAFLEGAPTHYDMGRLGKRYFLVMASYGLDAFAVRHTSLLLKKILGRYTYPLTGILGWPFYSPDMIEIFPDEAGRAELGADSIKASFAVFSNASRYAGEFIAAPGADMRDGLLDIVCWTKPGRLGAFAGPVNLFLGKLARKPWTRVFRAASVRFETVRPERFQVDGDPVNGDSGRVEVVPRAVQLVMPA